MVRGFRLLNEKGQEFSMMDIENYCLLTEPSGLGFSYATDYEQLGYTFIQKVRSIEQGKMPAIINFLNYDNYRKLIDFIQDSENLRLAYKIPYKNNEKEYYRDLDINLLTKSEIQTSGVLNEEVTLNFLSLWYEEKTLTYNLDASEENIMRWDFEWDSRFTDYDVSNLNLKNEGHIQAPILIELDGRVVNPRFELWIEGTQHQIVSINTTIEEYEKLLYGSKENDFYIKRQNTDGTLEDLFSLDVIDFTNDNVIRIPKNKSCEIKIIADTEVQKAKITMFVYYIAV